MAMVLMMGCGVWAAVCLVVPLLLMAGCLWFACELLGRGQPCKCVLLPAGEEAPPRYEDIYVVGEAYGVG